MSRRRAPGGDGARRRRGGSGGARASIVVEAAATSIRQVEVMDVHFRCAVASPKWPPFDYLTNSAAIAG